MTENFPKIAILGCGGTIAGTSEDVTDTSAYKAGMLSVDALVESNPRLSGIAHISTEQIANMDSAEIDFPLWVKIAQSIHHTLNQKNIDAVVLTHGTDTLEETAYFLHLVLKTNKPVVLTAAMRPASSISSDGALNLLNAVTVAASPEASGQGVLVVMNNRIFSARDVSKRSTFTLEAFSSPDEGALGWVQDKHLEFFRSVKRQHTLHSPFSIDSNSIWPHVEVVMSYAGATSLVVDAILQAKVQGIIVAGTGNGTMHSNIRQSLIAAAKKGVIVVRSSRVGSGFVMHNGAINDDELGFITAGSLSPFKARILLMLALMQNITDKPALQRIFNLY